MRKGMTLVELLVFMGIISLLFMVGGLSLANLERENQLDVLVSEIRTALLQAQARTVNGIPSGVYFESGRFVIFQGESFAEGDPKNEETILPTGISFSQINFPDNTVLFEKITGYVKDFVLPSNLTLLEGETGKTRTVSINRLGVIEIE